MSITILDMRAAMQSHRLTDATADVLTCSTKMWKGLAALLQRAYSSKGGVAKLPV
jgi:hypothetical protein